MKFLRASIRSLKSAVRKAYGSTMKRLNASLFGVCIRRLFSYKTALCRIASVGKRIMVDKDGNLQNFVPVNFHGNERVSDDKKNRKSLKRHIGSDLFKRGFIEYCN